MPLIEHEERQITDKEDIFSAFNDHFVNLGYSLADKIEVQSTEDRKKIPAKVLKDVVELVCVPLAIIFNESLWRGVCNVGLPSLR